MAVEEKDNLIISGTRLCFVDPSKVNGTDKTGNVEFTPPYEDMCVAFDLMIESYNRMDPNVRNTLRMSGVSGQDNFSILKGDLNIKDNKVYEKIYDGQNTTPDNNYLTTYYTEISSDGYVKKEIIEGLGVESIQVNYDNYYMPTVVIKFIDVRGSALFGREETIHTDNNGSGKLSAENIFGVFFTIPYPKFRLQLKGFYGQAVTYQLTCSGFDASFNSTTGNVEAIAKFIGYNWGILTDIPFAYLVAAPLCTYEGQKYWDSHVSDEKWELKNSPDFKGPPTSKPMLLKTLFDEIKTCVAMKNGDNNENVTENSSTNESATQQELLDELLNSINEFKKISGDKQIAKASDIKLNEIHNCFDRVELQLKACQNLITDFASDFNINPEGYTKGTKVKSYFDGTEYTYFDGTEEKTSNEKFYKNIIEYNDEIKDLLKYYVITKNAIYETDLNAFVDIQNKIIPSVKSSTKVRTYVTTNYSNVIDLRSYELDNPIVQNITNGVTTGKTAFDYHYMNALGKLCKVNKLKDLSSTDIYEIQDYEILDFSPVLSEIENNKKVIEVVKKSLRKKEQTDFINAALSNINFEPNIYNIFKILMCHLETLTHIMFACGSRIEEQKNNGLRTAEALGVKFNNTDIPPRYGEGTSLPPWTAIFNGENDTINNEEKLAYSTQYKWIGNLGGEQWEEEKVVLGFLRAFDSITPNTENTEMSDDTLNGIFTLPSDILLNNETIFSNTGNTIDSVCGNLGIRVAQLFGIMDRETQDYELIKIIGELDAYNYYYSCKTADILKIRFGIDENKNIDSDIIMGITTCDKDEKYSNYAQVTSDKTNYHYSFENERYDENGRQPIFKKFNGKYQYCYFKDKNNHSLVPSILKDFTNRGYNNYIHLSSTLEDKLYYEGQIKEDGYAKYTKALGWLYSNVNQILQYNNREEKFGLNENMFKIINDDSMINNLLKKYKKLKKGEFKIQNYEVKNGDKYNNFLNRYWNVSYSDYTKTINKNFSSTFIGKSMSNIKNIDKLPIAINKSKSYEVGGNNTTEANGDAWFNAITGWQNHKYTTYQLSEDESEENIIFNINNTDETIKLSDLYVKALYVYDVQGHSCGTLFNHPFYKMQNNEYVKALLFLQALKYETENNLGNILNCSHGKLVISNKLSVLYIGGLLWKYKNHDKFIYTENGVQYTVYGIQNTLTTGNGLCVRKRTPEDIKNAINKPVYKSGILKTFKDLTGIEIDDIDENVKQQFIFYFEDFVKNTFVKDIMLPCEKYITMKTDDERIRSPYFIIYNSENKTNDEYYILKENTQIQNMIKGLLFDKVIIMTNGKVNNKADLTIEANIYKNYLDSFLTTVKNICNSDDKKTETYNEGNSDDEGNSKNLDKDTLLTFYIYLKNLWEKWLVQVSSAENSDKNNRMERFEVDTFFKNNFVFVDSYYNDISTKLKINLETFYDIYQSRINDDANLYSVIGDIVSKHRCLFVGLPDYINMGIGMDEENDARGRENMKKLFTPIPYNKMNDFNIDNHFVVIYTYPPASEMPQEYAHRFDGFDLYSLDVNTSRNNILSTNKESIIIEASDAVKKIMGDNSNAAESGLTKYGYNIPSFAVAFGKQNNSIFKDFSITMKNPVMTEQSIKTYANIIDKGRQNSRAVCFYGQDVYSIYSNYSYSIEVEMMGCAQIQPLMYFQLLNVPMWRGAYMIYKVSHNMTPGNMSTRFTAMKMSKNPVPILSSFFNLPIEENIDYYSNNINLSTDIGSFIQGTKSTIEESGIDTGLSDKGKGASGENMDAGVRIGGNCTVPSIYLNMGHNNYTNPPLMEFKMDGGTYNLTKAINLLYNYAHYNTATCSKKDPTAPSSYCARHVWTAVGNGFGLNSIGAGDAWDDKSIQALEKLGFTKYLASESNFPDKVYAGDIIIQKYYRTDKRKERGHITMFTGNHWVSDFIQRKGLNNATGYLSTDTQDKTIGLGIFALFRIPGIENFKPSSTSIDGKCTKNNPGNVSKLSNGKWEGEIESSGRFAAFISIIYGFRCLFLNLHNTYLQKGKQTITSIISTWAPSMENKTDTYIKNMCNWMKDYGSDKITSNEIIFSNSLLTSNQARLIAFAKSMCRQEHSYIAENNDIEKGLNMAINYIKSKIK